MVEFEKLKEDIEAVVYGDKNDKFTKEGLKKYIECCNSYVITLYRESLRVSKINHTDNISSSHVSIAYNNLIRKKGNKILRLSGSIGGLLLGCSISNLFAMTTTGQIFSSTGIIATVAITIIGTYLFANQYIKE